MLIWERRQLGGVLRDIFGIGGAAQAVGSIASAGIQAAAATSAAHTQADATKYGVDATSKAAANSLAFNKDVYSTTQANEQPYMAAGASAAGQLQAGLSDGSLTAGYGPQFSYAANPNATAAPFSFTGVNLQNDPAYNFDLQQGQQARQRSAAAQGGLVSGGAMKDLDQYTQGFASNQFQNSYQNASNTYQQNYGNTGNTYQQSYSNALAQYQQAYNQFQNQQGNTYNRLAGTAGLGQNAVTGTATSGNAAAGNAANVNMGAANSIATQTAAGANAAGASMLSIGNAFSGATNSIANSLAQQSGSSYGPATSSVVSDPWGNSLPGAPAYRG